jgi:hypothetical protein
MSIAGFAVTLFVLIYPAAGLIPFWTSTAIRASHTSLPAFLSIHRLYRKLKPKKLVAVILLFLLISSTQIPLLATALQTNLSRTGDTVNRFSLDYRAPFFRLYQIAEHSGKTLVVASNPRGASTYLSFLSNVTLSPIPGNETAFRALVSGNWDMIILYDNYYTIKDPATIANYPTYYRQIVLGTQYANYHMVILWVDGESYALKLVKN